MPSNRTALTLLGLGAIWGIATSVAGPLPGDVALTRALQSIAAPSAGWAQALTDTGKMPLMAGLALLCAALAGWLAGWRSAIALGLSLAAAKLLEFALRTALHVDRPSTELVQVVAPSTSSGFPSTFGLVHGATVGFVLLAALSSRRQGSAAVALAASMLLAAGIMARVLPGGHWPSQMLASLLLALGLSALFLRGALRLHSNAARQAG